MGDQVADLEVREAARLDLCAPLRLAQDIREKASSPRYFPGKNIWEKKKVALAVEQQASYCAAYINKDNACIRDIEKRGTHYYMDVQKGWHKPLS